MNRRSLLSFLGLAPVAIATGAVAMPKEKTVIGLSVRGINIDEVVAGRIRNGNVTYDLGRQIIEIT
jgi:hypothetical protein